MFEIVVAFSVLLFFAIIFFENYRLSFYDIEKSSEIRSIVEITEKVSNYLENTPYSSIQDGEIDGYKISIDSENFKPSCNKLRVSIFFNSKLVNEFTYYKDVSNEI